MVQSPFAHYDDVALATLATNDWLRPRVKTEGKVVEVSQEEDKTIKVKLTDGEWFIYCWLIPQLPVTFLPINRGERLSVAGIARYDYSMRGLGIYPVVFMQRLGE